MNGRCVDKTYLCDGIDHCGDDSDEFDYSCLSGPLPFNNKIAHVDHCCKVLYRQLICGFHLKNKLEVIRLVLFRMWWGFDDSRTIFFSWLSRQLFSEFVMLVDNPSSFSQQYRRTDGSLSLHNVHPCVHWCCLLFVLFECRLVCTTPRLYVTLSTFTLDELFHG